MRRFWVALAFLTRFPAPDLDELRADDLARAAPAYPLVGALLGLTTGAVALVLAARLPATVAAAIAVALSALWTGGLHLDGLADTADGLGGGRDRESALDIMHDHRIGAYGAVALVVVLMIKVTALAALIERGQALPAMVAAGALSRASMVPICALPYAREMGLGAGVKSVSRTEIAVAVVFGCAAALWLPWVSAIATVLAVAGLTLHNALFFRRRIGGYTGDTLGAQSELAETVALIAPLFI
jgi:cobalamin 5'-phosphate synthase/cobalamin synthase